jgi:hypothetical protein
VKELAGRFQIAELVVAVSPQLTAEPEPGLSVSGWDFPSTMSRPRCWVLRARGGC